MYPYERSGAKTISVSGVQISDLDLFWNSINFTLTCLLSLEIQSRFCISFCMFYDFRSIVSFGGYVFLAASGVFFGNHPGGRFLELQDCLWIYWCVRGIVENKLYGNRILEDPFWKSRIGVLLLSFLGLEF